MLYEWMEIVKYGLGWLNSLIIARFCVCGILMREIFDDLVWKILLKIFCDWVYRLNYVLNRCMASGDADENYELGILLLIHKGFYHLYQWFPTCGTQHSRSTRRAIRWNARSFEWLILIKKIFFDDLFLLKFFCKQKFTIHPNALVLQCTIWINLFKFFACHLECRCLPPSVSQTAV